NSFNDYPKILKIEDDGKIIALDKYGNVNTDLNIHTVNDQQQQDTFGTILYNPYRRTVKNSESYNDNKYNDYKSETSYNQRDRERELQLLEENKKSKRKQFWLGLGMVILLFIIVIFEVSTFINGVNDDQQNANDTSDQS